MIESVPARLEWTPFKSFLTAQSVDTDTSYSIHSDEDGFTLFILNEATDRSFHFPELQAARDQALAFEADLIARS